MPPIERTVTTVEQVFSAPGPHPNGLQATAEGLWILDQHSSEIHFVSYSGDIRQTLQTDTDRGSGITFDGANLWVASTYSCELLHIHAATGETLARYATPGAQKTGAHGLEWREGMLWVATPPAATIYQVDPDDHCAVRHSFPAPGNRPHGIAWQEPNLWCAETNHRAVYLLEGTQGHILAKLTLPEDAPDPHGMSLWQDTIWYCDDRGAVCRFTLPEF